MNLTQRDYGKNREISVSKEIIMRYHQIDLKGTRRGFLAKLMAGAGTRSLAAVPAIARAENDAFGRPTDPERRRRQAYRFRVEAAAYHRDQPTRPTVSNRDREY